MANRVRHFEIEADDVERAKRFYQRVFGWQIRRWGPPNYYLIDAGDGMSGDIRERTNPAGPGNAGFVCTVVVDDLQAIKEAIVANGGTIVVPEFRIDGVGNLLYFTDTEGHRVGVMQRDGV
ncbi:MAG TPA: VOC family protein [Gammaproteobacteria bacterium]